MRSGVTLSSIADADTFISSSGDPVHLLYAPIVHDDGSYDLEVCGRQSIPDLINSYKDTTDMAYILSRINAGDMSVLEQTNPMYGDFTQFSYNPAQMLNVISEAQNVFDHLPAEVRKRFDNNFRTWFSQSGDPDFARKMSPQLFQQEPAGQDPFSPEPVPVPSDPVKEAKV